MGLAKRIIPTLLCRGTQLYKGKQFASWRSIGHAQQAVMTHQARGVDELILLDIDATPKGTGPNFKLIEELSKECFMPLTVGGGVRSVEDVKALMDAGADKVSICTAAIKSMRGISRYFIEECAEVFGSQAIVVSIDTCDGPNRWIAANCGREKISFNLENYAVDMDTAARWAEHCMYHGAGEILLTNIDREGMMNGYDLDLIRAVSEAVSIPVIAHGGCGTPQHALEAIQAGADAVAIGSMFAFTDETPASVAGFLSKNGVEVRQ